MKTRYSLQKFVLLYFFCLSCAISSHEITYLPHNWYTHYEHHILDATTLATLTNTQEFQLKDPDLLAWIAKNQDMLILLADQKVHGDLTNYAHNIASGNELLQQLSYTNVSSHNFVFKIHVGEHRKNYWVKIAGPNRFEQLNALLGRPWGTPVTQQDHEFLQEKTATYQSASRMSRYLLYKTWKAKHLDIPITVPETFLIPLSDEQLVDDAHCIIVEEHIEALGTPNEVPELFLTRKNDISAFIIELGLWNINSFQFLIKSDGTIVYLDLEDPDNSNPEYFFNAHYEKIKHNIRCGLVSFEQLCQDLNLVY